MIKHEAKYYVGAHKLTLLSAVRIPKRPLLAQPLGPPGLPESPGPCAERRVNAEYPTCGYRALAYVICNHSLLFLMVFMCLQPSPSPTKWLRTSWHFSCHRVIRIYKNSGQWACRHLNQEDQRLFYILKHSKMKQSGDNRICQTKNTWCGVHVYNFLQWQLGHFQVTRGRDTTKPTINLPFPLKLWRWILSPSVSNPMLLPAPPLTPLNEWSTEWSTLS